MKNLRNTTNNHLIFGIVAPSIVWQVLFLMMPLTILVLFAFGYYATGFTFSYFRDLIALPYILIIGRSLLLASITAFICLIAAYPVAYFLAIHIRRGKGIYLFFLTLPFWVSSLVQIHAWFYLLERQGLLNRVLTLSGLLTTPYDFANSLIGIVLVMTYCYMPFMLLPLYSAITRLDNRLLEASQDLGASAWQTFLHVTLPLTASGIKTGILLVLVPAFGEYAIPSLVGGNRYLLVGSLISYYFTVARNMALGAAFTIISGLALFIVAYLVAYLCERKNSSGVLDGQ